MEIVKGVSGYVEQAFGRHWQLLEYLKKIGKVVVFGGAPRDLLFYKSDKEIRDIDLVVSNISNEKLLSVLNKFISRRTRFGGINCVFENHLIDIWALEDNWAMKNGYFEPNIYNLPKSVFLNIDSIIVDLDTNKMYEHGIKKAFEKRELDIVFKENPFPSLCVLRTIIFKQKYEFKISNNLKRYIVQFMMNTQDPLGDLIDIQESHYKTERISRNDLLLELKNIMQDFV